MAVVLAGGLFGAASSTIVISPVLTLLLERSLTTTVTYAVTIVFGSLFDPIIVWFLYATVSFSILTVVYDSEIEFRESFRLVGWGFVPRAMGNAAILVLFGVALSTNAVGDTQTIGAYMDAVRSSDVYVGSRLLRVLFAVAGSYLMIRVLARSGAVDRSRASVAIGFATMIEVSWIVFTLG